MAGGAAPELVIGREMAEQACELLVTATPEALESCTDLLGAAVEKLRFIGEIPDAAEARRLHFAVLKAAKLLQNAADYHAGWISWLDARTGGYGATGEPESMASRRLVCVRG